MEGEGQGAGFACAPPPLGPPGVRAFWVGTPSLALSTGGCQTVLHPRSGRLAKNQVNSRVLKLG